MWQVTLREKNPSLGGRISQFYQYFPKMGHPGCGMEINLRHLKANHNVRVMTLCEISKVEGGAGEYCFMMPEEPLAQITPLFNR